jgi:nitrite reductase (NADH) small subunit
MSAQGRSQARIRAEARSAEGSPTAVLERRTVTQLVSVCAIAEIPVLGARVIERPGHPDGNVAVFRTADDRVFAVLDRCPHKGGPLSQGIVFGDRVACPLHNWTIELATGEAVAPDAGCARRFPVTIERGVVYVSLD